MSTLDPAVQEPGSFIVRILLIAFYLAVIFVIRFVLWGVLLIQVVSHLLFGHPSTGTQRVGQVVAEYIYRIWLYLSYNTNERPFPFGNRKR